MKHLKGNILDVRTGYILQQCNCITVRPYGLSADLSRRFPGTCPYDYRKPIRPGVNMSREEDRSEPGTVMIIGTEDGPDIINLFGQYTPGKAKPNSVLDKSSDREKYFQNGLDALIDFFDRTTEPITIAVPYKIGCGLAGGQWNHYKKMLDDFEKTMIDKGMYIDMTIYELVLQN
jgi:hypothetical protein